MRHDTDPRSDPAVSDTARRRKGWFGLYIVMLGVLIVIDFFVQRHAHVSWEAVRAFFPAFGVISCVVLVGVAQLLRLVLKRDETYYD